jgi:hypothetical protein
MNLVPYKENIMQNYSIKQASSLLGLSEVYIRRMIQLGKLETTKVAISDNVWRHEISEEVLNVWRNKAVQRTQRKDGRNKFVIYANAAELAKLQSLLETNQMNLPLERSNKPEQTKKSYLRRKAKLAAKSA